MTDFGHLRFQLQIHFNVFCFQVFRYLFYYLLKLFRAIQGLSESQEVGALTRPLQVIPGVEKKKHQAFLCLIILHCAPLQPNLGTVIANMNSKVANFIVCGKQEISRFFQGSSDGVNSPQLLKHHLVAFQFIGQIFSSNFYFQSTFSIVSKLKAL